MCDNFCSFADVCTHKEGTRCVHDVEMSRNDWQNWPHCNEENCPLWSEVNSKPFDLLEAPQSQCPLCGCETVAEDVDEGIERFNRMYTRHTMTLLGVGMLIGIVLCIVAEYVI